jgi:tetratricopeptide (TPR) repeat protein
LKKYFLILFGLIFQLIAVAQLNTDRILAIGQNALYFEDYVLSIQYFNQVIKIKPYLAEPYVYRAIAKIELGDFRGADDDCTQAIDRNPFLTQAYYARGFARRSLNLYPEAIEDFSKALEFSPNSLYLILNRMNTRELNKDYAGAKQDLELYLKINPKATDILFDEGRLDLAMKDTVAAENSFDRLITADSTKFIGWSARGLLEMQKNNIKAALSDYNQAVKLNTTFPGDFINRGILNVRTKNFNQALSDYNQSIKMKGDEPLSYYNRGLLRASLGDYNNALSDLNMVLKLDSTNSEALLRKAMLEITLRDYQNAIIDYKVIIQRHPYFIPAFLGVADAEQGLGHEKNAFRYRQLADNIEKNKDVINRKLKEEIKTDNKMSTAQQNSSNKNTNLFDRFIDQNGETSQTPSKYSDEMRGQVQDRYADVVNERNFVLTYYAKTDEIRRTNLYYPVLEEYNKKNKLSSALKITNNELPLTAQLINSHFERINELSALLNNHSNDADVYFIRAMEFVMVQDFKSAIDDLNKAIEERPDFMLAYFCRANVRYKLVEYNKNNAAQKNAISINGKVDNQLNKSQDLIVSDKESLFNVELIMSDYDKVISLNPDFSYAYFNKANILCTQKNFQTAILNYTQAIQIDPDFAEAYFNRGLTYLFIGEDTKGLADLSKAGELGIYKSYNLMQRFKK